MKMVIAAVVAAAGLAACVPYPQEAQNADVASTSVATGPGKPLGEGEARKDSVHFTVHAYGGDKAADLSARAEAIFQTITTDTGLYPFMPSRAYGLVVYGNRDEYRNKTDQPSWSPGFIYDNVIYTYAGGQLDETLAHDETHLIFEESMGRTDSDWTWVEEGLAVFEQAKAAGSAGIKKDFFPSFRNTLRMAPLTLNAMIHTLPASEKDLKLDIWYAQADSVVEFMIARGGVAGMGQFLQALKGGKTFDEAVSAAFPGNWGNLSGVYAAWQQSLQ
jgi:hypothetical protein